MSVVGVHRFLLIFRLPHLVFCSWYLLECLVLLLFSLRSLKIASTNMSGANRQGTKLVVVAVGGTLAALGKLPSTYHR
jgi:hypothetical protein